MTTAKSSQGPRTGTAIPPNVYYHFCRFYDTDTRNAMDATFADTWRHRFEDFPKNLEPVHAMRLAAPAAEFYSKVFIGKISPASALSGLNKRFDLDPVLVQDQLERKCTEYAASRLDGMAAQEKLCAEYVADMAAGRSKNWTRAPDCPDTIDQFYSKLIAEEKTHYATVRIIERPSRDKPFILVYGDADDTVVTSGTGGFESLQKAAAWYLNGGR